MRKPTGPRRGQDEAAPLRILACRCLLVVNPTYDPADGDRMQWRQSLNGLVVDRVVHDVAWTCRFVEAFWVSM